MLRRSSIFVVVFAAILVVEPLLHNHSLEGKAESSVCAICVAGTAKLPVVVPSVAAPTVVAYTIQRLRVRIASVETPMPRASRAPPAA